MLKKIIFIGLVITLSSFIYLTYQKSPTPAPELRTRIITSQIPETTCHFQDTEDPLITQFCKLGIVNGYDDGNFRPNATANRAEMLKMTFLFFGKSQASEAITELLQKNHLWPFKDTPPDFWASPYIALAKLRGDIKGYKNGEFIGYQDAKRGEAWKMMVDAGAEADLRIKAALKEIRSHLDSSDAWFDAYAQFGRQIGMQIEDESVQPLWKSMDESIHREEIIHFLSRMVNFISTKPIDSEPVPTEPEEAVLMVERAHLLENPETVLTFLNIHEVILPESTLNENMSISQESLQLLEKIREVRPELEVSMSIGNRSIPFIIRNATNVDIISKVIDDLIQLAQTNKIKGLKTHFDIDPEDYSSGDLFLIDIVEYELNEAFKKADLREVDTTDHEELSDEDLPTWYTMTP